MNECTNCGNTLEDDPGDFHRIIKEIYDGDHEGMKHAVSALMQMSTRIAELEAQLAAETARADRHLAVAAMTDEANETLKAQLAVVEQESDKAGDGWRDCIQDLRLLSVKFDAVCEELAACHRDRNRYKKALEVLRSGNYVLMQDVLCKVLEPK